MKEVGNSRFASDSDVQCIGSCQSRKTSTRGVLHRTEQRTALRENADRGIETFGSNRAAGRLCKVDGGVNSGGTVLVQECDTRETKRSSK